MDSQEFIELVNAIFVEKVRLEEFDIRSDGYTYIRNTYDHDGNENFIIMRKYPTEIYLSILRGHFRKPSPLLDKIYVKGLFTEEIERQVDLTPPEDFTTIRKYYIEVLEYKGTLSVSRAHVSIYFQNLGAPDPTPTPPGPPSPICKYMYLVFTGVFFLICLIIAFIVFKLKKRRKK